MSTGRSASFEGLVIALISVKDGRTLLSSGGSPVWLFEEDLTSVVSWGVLTSLPSDVLVVSCADFNTLDPNQCMKINK